MVRFLFCAFLLAALLAGAVGCTPRQSIGEPPPFEAARPVDNHLTIVLDLSGSFHAQLARDGKVMAYLQRVIARFFEAGAGTERNDRLLIAFIAADRLPIFFEGSPRQFQEAFRTPDDLRKALFARADPNASRVFDSISDAVEHALGSDGVVAGKTRLSLLILSDLVDNVHTAETPVRFERVLSAYARARGGIGLHWLPHDQVRPWHAYLARCGFAQRQVCVTADFQPEAPLPNF